MQRVPGASYSTSLHFTLDISKCKSLRSRVNRLRRRAEPCFAKSASPHAQVCFILHFSRHACFLSFFLSCSLLWLSQLHLESEQERIFFVINRNIKQLLALANFVYYGAFVRVGIPSLMCKRLSFASTPTLTSALQTRFQRPRTRTCL